MKTAIDHKGRLTARVESCFKLWISDTYVCQKRNNFPNVKTWTGLTIFFLKPGVLVISFVTNVMFEWTALGLWSSSRAAGDGLEMCSFIYRSRRFNFLHSWIKWGGGLFLNRDFLTQTQNSRGHFTFTSPHPSYLSF